MSYWDNHITFVLHWLPLFLEILLLTFKTSQNLAPLSELLHMHTPSLHSQVFFLPSSSLYHLPARPPRDLEPPCLWNPSHQTVSKPIFLNWHIQTDCFPFGQTTVSAVKGTNKKMYYYYYYMDRRSLDVWVMGGKSVSDHHGQCSSFNSALQSSTFRAMTEKN